MKFLLFHCFSFKFKIYLRELDRFFLIDVSMTHSSKWELRGQHEESMSLGLPRTFRPTIFLKLWFFGNWSVLSMIFHLTKKLLKNIKLWRRKHGFLFWPEVKLSVLTDRPLTTRWRVCSQPRRFSRESFCEPPRSAILEVVYSGRLTQVFAIT